MDRMSSPSGLTRRGFLMFSGAAVAAMTLASCAPSGSGGGGGGGGGGTLKFWNMPWGQAEFGPRDADANRAAAPRFVFDRLDQSGHGHQRRQVIALRGRDAAPQQGLAVVGQRDGFYLRSPEINADPQVQTRTPTPLTLP